jgi:translation initiation factor 4G
MDAPDNWKSRGQPPPPLPAARDSARNGSGRSSSDANLHKTGNRYTLGQTQNSDPDEEKKQRSFKGILNKLTIDNFEKLSRQVS